MIFRLSSSLFGWSQVLKGLSWKRPSVEDLGRTLQRYRGTGNCGIFSRSSLCSAWRGQSHTVTVVFPELCSEATGCTGDPTVMLAFPHPAKSFQEALVCTPRSKIRQLHTCSKCCTPFGSPTRGRNVTQRHSPRARYGKRLPLSQKQEIEEVVENHSQVILEFAAALGCSQEAVRDMVRRDTRLVTVFDKKAVMTKMRLLLDRGFSPADILSRYQVFSRSVSHLQSRLQAMVPVKQYRYSLAMVLLSDSDFRARMALYRKEVTIMGQHSSQASFLSELLGCPLEEVLALADEEHQKFLLTMPPSRLQQIVSLLRFFGLSLADIRAKCLMLRCPPDLARERLQRVWEAGVFHKKLVAYILTNSHAHFEASFATWVRNARALGSHASHTQLLMHRLQCSEDDVRSLMSRNVRVASMGPAKIRHCLDVLQEEMGLSAEVILQQGTLLYYSPQRLRARWALLKPLGLSQLELAQELRRSERKFIAKYGYGSD